MLRLLMCVSLLVLVAPSLPVAPRVPPYAPATFTGVVGSGPGVAT